MGTLLKNNREGKVEFGSRIIGRKKRIMCGPLPERTPILMYIQYTYMYMWRGAQQQLQAGMIWATHVHVCNNLSIFRTSGSDPTGGGQ